mmetsp:Transcript_54214/g.121555  ORF Transcript_54214/g.121555 Transcript_54214/m.121555 type:complete len:1321 (-) Transcript_54214:92-4054(-)
MASSSASSTSALRQPGNSFRASRKTKRQSVRFNDVEIADKDVDYTASNIRLQQCGVPEDYFEALMDNDYIDQLIHHTDRMNAKRDRRMDRYQRLNKLIFTFLCLQAALGIVVALYKTIFQPTKIVEGSANLDNVDVVLATDAAGHFKGELGTLGREVSMIFAEKLNSSLMEKREETLQGLVEKIEESRDARENSSPIRRWFPFLNYIMPKRQGKDPTVRGGWLRVLNLFFNAMGKIKLHDFTRELKEQEAHLNSVSEDIYKSTAQWMTAMEGCKAELLNGGAKSARSWCIMMADSETSCKKQEPTVVSKYCQKHPERCPPTLDKFGSPLEKSIDDCISYAQDMKLPPEKKLPEIYESDEGNINLAIILYVKSEQHAQQRLENQIFRQFIQGITGCAFTYEEQNVTDAVTHETKWVGRYVPDLSIEGNDKSCAKFITGSDRETLREKAGAIADLLKTDSGVQERNNELQNPNYLLFLLLCLNLPLYILWSKVVRCGQAMQVQYNRQMGVKKKMIKVTKTLIEKEEESEDVKNFKSQLTELEMAEVQRMSPNVEFGSTVTLRARLKGGFLRSNDEARTADGNGTVFDPNAGWTFEAVDPAQSGVAGDAVHAGHPVMIKNSRGDYLSINETGVSIIPGRGGQGADPAQPDVTAQFVLEPVLDAEDNEGKTCHLGDFIQVRSLATGNLLRVHKDGHCDGVGRSAEPETQFSIDRGGKPINSGNIVSLRSHVTQEHLFGGLEGELSAGGGGEAWKYWMLERKGDNVEGDNRKSAVAGGGPLKEGDVVTLKGINQNFMELDAEGKGLCKNKANPELVQDFIIERVGMGLKKHDGTIRSGSHICLKPLPRSTAGAGAEDKYLKVTPEGDVVGNGRITSPEIAFTLEIPDMSEMIDPLDDVLQQGDCTMLVNNLWNKSDVKKLEALSAAWTTDEQLTKDFRGHVVAANEQGQYQPPKNKGEGFQGWVAVVKDNVNIAKAAKQAKAQGATGLIVRCGETLTINKLSKTTGEDVDLPVVFCDDAAGEAVSEKGNVLKGIEMKGKHLTDALRSVAAVSKTRSRGNVKEVFDKVGTLMVMSEEERLAKIARGEFDQPQPQEQDQHEDAQGNFKWKVSSNTHYLWSTGGAGAGKMNVNFGKVAPPSAHKETKLNSEGKEVRVDADASQNKVYTGLIKRKPTTRAVGERRTVTGTAFVPADDVKTKRNLGGLDLSGGVDDDVTYMDSQDHSALAQLPDESDFRIQYDFKEVEVEKDEKVEDLEDVTHIDDAGATVGKFAVPVKRFWIVCLGMFLSTLILTGIVYIGFYPDTINEMFGWPTKEDKAPAGANYDDI